MPAGPPQLIDLTRTRKKLPTGCWVALGVAAAIIVLVLLAAGAIIWIGLAGMQGPRNVDLTVNHPFTASPGQSFQIEVLIHNTDSDSQSLDSIDIYNEYLQGVRIRSSDPPYTDRSSFFGITTFWFDRDIAPGRTLRVLFTAEALQPGFYIGDFDVCINNSYTYATYVIQTEVTDDPNPNPDPDSDAPSLPDPAP